jgi:hypothetical protein
MRQWLGGNKFPLGLERIAVKRIAAKELPWAVERMLWRQGCRDGCIPIPWSGSFPRS